MGTFLRCGITDLALFVLFLYPFGMHSATTRIKVNFSSENISPTEFFSTEAIISTEKTTFDEATSTPVKTSMNQNNTKEALHTTDVKRTTKAMTTSSLVLATTEGTSLTSVQSTENLSTISVHRNDSQTTLPEKKTKDRPINPAIIVVALTSSLTFVIVIIGFFLRRYTKSRLDRKHCDANREKTQLGKQRLV